MSIILTFSHLSYDTSIWSGAPGTKQLLGEKAIRLTFNVPGKTYCKPLFKHLNKLTIKHYIYIKLI